MKPVDILLFAKAPIPGKVKTRLMTELTAEEACDLYLELLNLILDKLKQLEQVQVKIWAVGAEYDFFQNIGFSVVEQIDGDLGDKMQFAVEQSLNKGHAAILIGADCPAMTIDYIQQAVSGLHRGNQAVIGGSEDGGYVLLGLQQSHVSLFEDIHWGSNQVYATTIQRLKALGFQYLELPALWDLDEPADLLRFRQEQD